MDTESDFPCAVAVSAGAQCDHCHMPIQAGFLRFRFAAALHGGQKCDHWICLSCTSRPVRQWTKERLDPTYAKESA